MSDFPFNATDEIVLSLLAGGKSSLVCLDRALPKDLSTGDRLWVRERLEPVPEESAAGHRRGIWLYYAADRTPVPGNRPGYRSKPAARMPRWANRITLTVSDVELYPLFAISGVTTDTSCIKMLPDLETISVRGTTMLAAVRFRAELANVDIVAQAAA